jgi:hypothetical protein
MGSFLCGDDMGPVSKKVALAVVEIFWNSGGGDTKAHGMHKQANGQLEDSS